MKLRVCCFMFCALLHVEASDRGGESNGGAIHSNDGILEFEGLELLRTKFDLMANKLEKLENKLESIENQMNKHRTSQERGQQEVLVALHKLERQGVFNLSEFQNRNQGKMLTTLQNVESNVTCNTSELENRNTVFSCKNVSNVSGTYWIRVNSTFNNASIRVYCEQQKLGGGWIVIQYRYDGTLDFNRNWNEFRDGFGDLEKEFWLGLEKVHQITTGRRHELIVELKDFNGTYKYARYDEFEIGSEQEQYVLKNVGLYTGTAGDEMNHSKGNKFSTKDRDNDDLFYENCAYSREGAWWHGSYFDANLNGRYSNAEDDKSNAWFTFNSNWMGLSFTKMMIRELD